MIAAWGRTTRATRGQRPAVMTALTSPVFALLRFSEGDEGLLPGATRLSETSVDRNSARRDVMSRTEEGDMKFCGVSGIQSALVAGVLTYVFAKSTNCRSFLTADLAALFICIRISEQVAVGNREPRPCPDAD